MIMVKNGSLITPPVIIDRGVKQGGPLSPRLYSVYVEEMLNELEVSGVEAWFNQILINAIMYADDTILLAENENSMNILIKIVQKYCNKNEIKLNMDKTVYLIINSKSTKSLKVENLVLKPEKSTKYLG